MELKLRQAGNKIKLSELLIVPYGIETYFACIEALRIAELLIVPYGIETAESAIYSDYLSNF